ncbi:MAG TPA: ImmA/IrrE family metallo-endopeptidase [Thermoguttaceae bacterium]|nr:ImmA/IrrE family metallo-endopeptidase [Thermoguttaceae bacterium]
MISVDRALAFARQHYPAGPEKLAEHLGVRVTFSPMSGCDGWCLFCEDRAVIRINNQFVKSRQRFTLAHELGHLLLDIPTVIGESFSDILRSNDDEERRVNEVAAELLIPQNIVKAVVSELPVVAAVLKRLAKQSHVSELAAALRIANLAAELGLEKASVVFFEGDTVSWQRSQTLRMADDTAINLRDAAREAAPNAFRHIRKHKGDVIVASLIENPFFGSATLFVQLLPVKYGQQKSRDEQRAELEQYLFDGQVSFQRQLQGCFGAFKPRAVGMSVSEAEDAFWERYEQRFSGIPKKRLTSQKGREYVRLRLEEWCGHFHAETHDDARPSS